MWLLLSLPFLLLLIYLVFFCHRCLVIVVTVVIFSAVVAYVIMNLVKVRYLLYIFCVFFLLICPLFLFCCCIVIWAVEVHLLPYCLVAFVLKFNQGALPPRCLPLELLHLLQDPQGVGLWSRQQQSLWPGGKKHKEGRRNTEHISGVPRPGKGEERDGESGRAGNRGE